MKRAFLLFLLPAIQAFGAWPNGYSYRLTEAINYTKVGTTDHTNYPATYIRTYAQLAHTTNGGYATNLNGYDIIITSDAAGSTKLDHEIESYNNVTGAVVFHFREPSVSHTVNTTFYVFVGNSSVTTSQEVVTGVWNSNYKAVFHLPNGTTLTSLDSTQYNNDTAPGGVGPAAGSGKFDGGMVSVSGDDGLYKTTADAPTGTAVFTLSTWFKLSADATSSMGGWGGNAWNGARANLVYINPNALYLETVNLTAGFAWTYNTDWHHFVIVHASGTTVFEVLLYLDGVLKTRTLGTDGTFNLQNAQLRIGDAPGTFDSGSETKGSLDEFRISDVARSADWVLAEFNNQSDPATFFTSNGTFEEPATSSIKAVSTVPLAGIGKIAGELMTTHVKKVAGVANQ